MLLFLFAFYPYAA